MKRLIYLLIALGLITIILFAAVADVNYGYGPGYTPYGYDSYNDYDSNDNYDNNYGYEN